MPTVLQTVSPLRNTDEPLSVNAEPSEPRK